MNPVHFQAVTPKDPKPHYRFKNLKLLAAGLLALGASRGIDPGRSHVRAFDAWSETRAEAITETANLQTDDWQEVALDKVAQMDKRVTENTAAKKVRNLYLWLLSWQLIFLGFAGLNQARKKTIPPAELWKSLHQRGITGKGLKIGVVDSGYKPTWKLPQSKTRFFQPDNLNQTAKPYDKVGHGTAVANLIAQGVPDAEFVSVAYMTREQSKKISKNVNNYLAKGFKNPEKMQLMEFRKLFAPLLENIAAGVRKAVDEGTDVVNVSLSKEQAVQNSMMLAWTISFSAFVLEKLTKPVWPQEMYESLQSKHRAFQEKLGYLRKAKETSEEVTTELKDLYKPWLEALDYAHSKNVPVVLAAGNDGDHKSKKGNLVGNVNLLGLVDHPALVIVGSANAEGQISHFTSEWNDLLRPWIAANGSGEISTTTRVDRSWQNRVLFPFGGLGQKLKYGNPPGTSFAAPDTTTTYAMMKAVKPDITIEEARLLMAGAASHDVSMGWLMTFLLKDQVEKRVLEKSDKKTPIVRSADWDQAVAEIKANPVALDNPESLEKPMAREIAGEMRRRVGNGMLQRLAAVQAAEELARAQNAGELPRITEKPDENDPTFDAILSFVRKLNPSLDSGILRWIFEEAARKTLM